jgi:hypothetical protein
MEDLSNGQQRNFRRIYVKCPIPFFFDFNHISIFSTDSPGYQIPRKSVQWEMTCYTWTDEEPGGGTDTAKIVGCILEEYSSLYIY